MKWIGAGSICAFLLAISVPVLAMDAAEERLARAYYDEAVKELEKSGPGKARPMFERVITLGPNSIGARLMLGECNKREGKLASAWRAYREAIDVATRIDQPIRAEQAARLAASLEPRLAKFKMQWPEEAWQMPGLEIRIDEKVVDVKTVRMDVPVDIGEHVIAVSAQGKKRVEKTFVVQNDGVTLDVAVEPPVAVDPPLPPEKPKPTVEVAPAVPAPDVVDYKPVVPVKPVVMRPVVSPAEQQRKTAGYALVGAGAAALVVGGAVGIVSLDKRNASNDGFCQGNLCKPAGIALREESMVAGDAATVLLMAATGFGVTGGLLLHWPSKKAERVGLAVGPTGFEVRGSF